MSLSKLKQIHVIIIGSFLCLASGAALFFLMIKPQMAERDAAKARYDAAVVVGNEGSLRQAMQGLNSAILQVQAEQQRYAVRMRQKMPNLSFKRRDLGMLALWREQGQVLEPLLSSFVRDKRLSGVSAAFGIPSPPRNPNDPLFDQDVMTINMGTITAYGDFKTLMNHLSRWNSCNRLVMVDQPSLSLTENGLALTYNATCYIMPMEKGGPPIAMAGAPGAAPAGGAPGGAPAMAPGGAVGVPTGAPVRP